MTNLLATALAAERVVLSVVGAHAGESEKSIFARKRADLIACDRTFWLYHSHSARPDRTQTFFAKDKVCSMLFFAPVVKNGARPTRTIECAKEASSDRKLWCPLPKKVSPVTGKLPAYAFVLSSLETCEEEIDVWQYSTSDFTPVRFRLGASTLLAERYNTSQSIGRPKSRFRRVVAVAECAAPRAVWIR